MTGEVVSLRRARRRRLKAADAEVAAANRVSFGVSRHEKAHGEAERRLVEQRLSGHLRSARPTPSQDDA